MHYKKKIYVLSRLVLNKKDSRASDKNSIDSRRVDSQDQSSGRSASNATQLSASVPVAILRTLYVDIKKKTSTLEN